MVPPDQHQIYTRDAHGKGVVFPRQGQKLPLSWGDQKRKGLCDQKRNYARVPLSAGDYPLI